jgi:mannose-6-phosphate isomerase
MEKPVRLTPSLREKLWGKKRLSPWFPDVQQPVGEAWFLSPREIPLLVKLIFTTDRLSVQLHPADGEAGPRGKTEMWHILEAEPGATIALGFREPVTREQLREAARTAEIERLLNWMPVSPGETYIAPAHTVHAIGAGIVLCEVQQNCDITYRLWDYDRQRDVHVEQAIPIAELGVHPGPVTPKKIAEGREELANCRCFVTERTSLMPGESVCPDRRRSQLWICLGGCGTIGGEPFNRGEVWLLPDEGEQPRIQAESEMRLLRTYAP